MAAIESTLRRRGMPYRCAPTWTTDAICRGRRHASRGGAPRGCATVEMEAAGVFAVARFRGKRFGQLLYAGDDLSGDAWDHRGWSDHATVRELLFWLAAEACLAMA